MTVGLTVKRTNHILLPNPRRVLAKAHFPGEEIVPGGESRGGLLMGRILGIPETEVAAVLAGVMTHFSSRHREQQQRRQPVPPLV